MEATIVDQIRLNAHNPPVMRGLIVAELARLSRLSSAELANEQKRACEFCGCTLEPKWLAVPEALSPRCGVWVWPTCRCPGWREDDIRRRAEAERTSAQVASARYAAQVERAGLIGLLAKCTFDSFKSRTDWLDSTKVLYRVREYANAVLRGDNSKPWLILHGNFGTGKSHLAAAVIRECIDGGMNDCFFRDWVRYVQRIKATWNHPVRRDLDDDYGSESEEEILRELARGRIVVIDDLDKQPATEWSRATLYGALNQRYNGNLPTVLTFNHDLADRVVLDYIGGAILDRIMQHAFDIVEFNGSSYRTQA